MGFSNPKTFPGKPDKVCISKQMSTITIYRLISKGFLYHEYITKRNIGSITASIRKNKNLLLDQQTEEKYYTPNLLIIQKKNLAVSSEDDEV